MKRKNLKRLKQLLLLLLIISIFTCSQLNAKSRKHFNPISKLNLKTKIISPGEDLAISGKGFIANLTEIYRVKLENINNDSQYQLNIISSNFDELKIETPEDLPYGTYTINIKLQSNYLKSKNISLKEKLKVAPVALDTGIESKQILSDLNNWKLLIQKLILDYNKELSYEDIHFSLNKSNIENNFNSLVDGENSLEVFYYDQGFKSKISQAIKFCYIDIAKYNDSIDIVSENPLKTFLIERENLNSIDISKHTFQEESNGKNYFFIQGFDKRKLFATKADTALFAIEKLKVIGDEFAVIKNMSPNFISLSNCSLADTSKLRYSFPEILELAAKSSIKIKTNLGLNNTGSDQLQMICEYQTEEDTTIFKVEDSFSYSGVDKEGFAVKEG
ncbi:MAG: hypothetical protein MK033_00970 [Candidatus Caenarcaniphilales bacterium]|nr:hypothetical protein [Candidatus Caenarcaniphilales bacterium]